MISFSLIARSKLQTKMRHAILTIAVLLLSSLASIHAGEQTLDAQTGISKTAKIELENGFRNPPDSVRPRTWWHWREGRISKEGITAELEAMKAALSAAKKEG